MCVSLSALLLRRALQLKGRGVESVAGRGHLLEKSFGALLEFRVLGFRFKGLGFRVVFASRLTRRCFVLPASTFCSLACVVLGFLNISYLFVVRSCSFSQSRLRAKILLLSGPKLEVLLF